MDVKTEYITKKLTIELSNDTFAERKCCQVFAYESETFHRRRSNNISHCENVEKNPQNVPFRLHYVDPHLTQQCLGPPQASSQTAAPMIEEPSHTYAVKSPLDTMVRRKCVPKSTPSRGPIPKLHYLPHPWTRPTYNAKRIRIRSAVFPQCTGHWTDRRTDARTDRQNVRWKVWRL